MHTFMDWVQLLLCVTLLVVILCGLIAESREQNKLRDEIELLNERMDRAGLPDRLPVHVITDAGPAPAEVGADPDVTDTTVMPVVGRHRIERLQTLPSLPQPGEVAEHAALVDLDD